MGCSSSKALAVGEDYPQSRKTNIQAKSPSGVAIRTAEEDASPGERDRRATRFERSESFSFMNEKDGGIGEAATFDESNELELRGVSVDYLATTFLDEICAAGFSKSTMVYEIEPGVIRTKGQDLVCPRDNRMGTAYVDAICPGPDASHAGKIGRATYMLSYTWGYQIGEIVDTLSYYCQVKGSDPKTTFIWICCLCINQHRVAELAAKNEFVAPEEFFASFGQRVTNIGHMLSLMAPWDDPKYITRVWCCFEMHTALQNPSVEFEIIMPPGEAKKLQSTLANEFDSVIKVISYLDVTLAKATVEADKQQIFQHITQYGGGFRKFNHDMVAAMRKWLLDTVDFQLATMPAKTPEDLEDRDDLNMGAAQLNHDLGDVDRAASLYDEILAFRRAQLRKTTPNTTPHARAAQAKAHVMNRYADLLKDKADVSQGRAVYEQHMANVESMFRESLQIYEDALASTLADGVMAVAHGVDMSSQAFRDRSVPEQEAIRANKKILVRVQETAAGAVNNLANFLNDGHRVDEALPFFERAHEIFAEINPNGLEMASILNNLARVYRKQRRLGDAEKLTLNSLEITEGMVGKDHTDVATKLTNLAEIIEDVSYDLPTDEAMLRCKEAGEHHYRALRIVEKTLGRDHPRVAEALNNLAANQQLQAVDAVTNVVLHPDLLDKALMFYQQSIKIDRAAFGPKSSGVAMTLQNLGTCLVAKKDFAAAAKAFEECMEIKAVTHGPDSDSYAGTMCSLADMRYRQKRVGDATRLLLKALAIYRANPSDTTADRIADRIAYVEPWLTDIKQAHPAEYNEAVAEGTLEVATSAMDLMNVR